MRGDVNGMKVFFNFQSAWARKAFLINFGLTWLFVLRCVLIGAAERNTQPLEVSLPGFTMGPDESVQEISCQLVGGVITAIKIPRYWNVRLDASIGGRVQLKAEPTVFSQGLAKPDLNYFQDFITIASDTSQWAPHPMTLAVTLSIGRASPTKPLWRELRFTTPQMILRSTKSK